MEDAPPHLYRREALELGHDPLVVERAIAETERLRGLSAPSILTLGHLAHRTGASYGYLREIVERRRDPYTDIAQRKRRGGTRPISSPDPPLMDVQRWLLHSVLDQLPLHESCFAYRGGRSFVDCARRHLGARWLVKLDLHDFFGTISERRVYRVFRSIGYAPLVSFELARLTTRTPWPIRQLHRERGDGRVISDYCVAIMGRLPQGSPTSGALANAVTTPLDHRLAEIARTNGWTYSRYSDDLTFSTAAESGRDAARGLVRIVCNAVTDERFEVHRSKTRIVPPGSRHVVLGLLVDDDKLRLVPEFKRRVEVHVRGVDRFGLAQHAAHRRFRSILSFVGHVDGCLAYAGCIEPAWTDSMRARWSSALSSAGFPV